MDETGPHNERLPDEVRKKVEKKLDARRTEKRSLWHGLGLFGLVGWAVALPTVAMVALGVWLDRTLDDDYSWTLALLLAGVFLGCMNAWYWVSKESKAE
ncbi:AtpZ/AtpI family protein [Persicimonas caeni]|uniref:AtpZ/AtpI family protein n=1 Tax=Persicimonas caeni TaxID=2292766 RepID=UPI001C9B3379|nr:AtpZ/AtpI family protein [Persicimonas caeni]